MRFKITNTSSSDIFVGRYRIKPTKYIYVEDVSEQVKELSKRGMVRVDDTGKTKDDKKAEVVLPDPRIGEILDLLKGMVVDGRPLVYPSSDINGLTKAITDNKVRLDADAFSPTKIPDGEIGRVKVDFNEAFSDSPDVALAIEKLRQLQTKKE